MKELDEIKDMAKMMSEYEKRVSQYNNMYQQNIPAARFIPQNPQNLRVHAERQREHLITGTYETLHGRAVAAAKNGEFWYKYEARDEDIAVQAGMRMKMDGFGVEVTGNVIKVSW